MDERSAKVVWSILGLLVAMGVFALAIDLPISAWCVAERAPGGVKKLLHLAEVFGHGAGVVAILMTVLVLDPERRWAVPRLAMGSLGAGLLANLGKLLIARVRPHHCDFSLGVTETFLGWLPAVSRPSFEQGFPSSHAATAVGLAVGLSWLYPRGRYWFAILACLVAAQRIEAGAHFLSDTFWGAAVGFAIGTVAVRLPSLGYLGNWLERCLGSKHASSRRTLSYSPQSSANSRS